MIETLLPIASAVIGASVPILAREVRADRRETERTRERVDELHDILTGRDDVASDEGLLTRVDAIEDRSRANSRELATMRDEVSG